MKTISSDTYLQDLPLDRRHWYVTLVASMEQLIGAALSTIVGIVIPLLNLMLHPQLSASVQGIMGAIGLVGIAIGSAIVGPFSDRVGYLKLFRLCAVLVVVGSFISILNTSPLIICTGLFIAGFGIGGGYTLDSAYISELMPDRWRSFMMGIAKTLSAVGFVLPAAVGILVLKLYPNPHVWRWMIVIVGVLGAVTLCMRMRWAESPGWLMAKGRYDDALKSARYFFGPGVTLRPLATGTADSSTNASSSTLPSSSNGAGLGAMFRGKNLLRVIYSGIPWACEGLGVYGIGVFLPVLLIALGLDHSNATGIPKIINSVEYTAVINFSILPGFVIGLLIVNRLKHSFMLWAGFIGSAFGMGLLLAAYLLQWPVWVSVVAFMMFEILLNAGPHLVTYIIPPTIYPVADRGLGTGIADFLGKLGAILGVFFMPMLLKAGGITLVLIVTIAVMLAGSLIAFVFSRLLRI